MVFIMIYAHQPLEKYEKIKDFRYISGHFFQDGYRHHFSLILSRFGLHFGMLFGAKVGKNGFKKTQQKHTCQKVTREIQGDPAKSENASCGPLKQFKDPRFKDW